MSVLRGLPGLSASRQRRIAENFSRAAEHYDDAAQFQRQVADELLSCLPVSCRPRALLDVGCGTGYVVSHLALRFDATAIGLDLAPGMLAEARRRHDDLAIQWLTGNAERLPLAGRSLDLVISSLALQWCDLERFLAQAARVLRPHGWLAFTTLCEGSLSELREAWQTVDGGRHVNDCLPEAALRQSLASPGWRLQRFDLTTRRIWHDDLAETLRALKRIGANTVTGEPASSGLAGRRRFARLESAIETFRDTSGIPTRYRVATVLMQRLDAQD